MNSAVVSILRTGRADLRVLSKDGFLLGSWLVAACLLGIGLSTATAFTQFVVLAGALLPQGFYTRQAIGLVVLALNFPFVILGGMLGGSDFPRGTYQNRVTSSGRTRLGIARLIALTAVCIAAVLVIIGVGTTIDTVRPEVHPLSFETVVLLWGSVSLVTCLWSAMALLIALLSRSVLAGILLTWGVLAVELLATTTQAASNIVSALPLHVGLSLLNALTVAPKQEVVNLHPPHLLDPTSATIAAMVWIVALGAGYLAVMARREF
jgi:hypothetical protein